MSELKWNWVYYPYLDAPNKQKESALNAGYIKVVIKDEADAVIKELKAQKAQAEDDCAYWKMREGNAVNAMHETEEYAMQLYKELRHHKYKRCLAMAKWCEERYNYLTCLENWQMTDKEYQQVIGDYWDRWNTRWLKIAEQFKDKEAK